MRRYTINVNGIAKVVDVEAAGANLFRVLIDGRLVDVELTDHRDLAHSAVTPAITPSPAATPVAPVPSAAPVAADGPAPAASPVAGAAPAAPAASGRPAGGSSLDKMTAPMPGVVLSVNTTVGAAVRRGDSLVVLEAMKMKNELKSPRDGTVAELYVSAGQQVKYGEFLVRFED